MNSRENFHFFTPIYRMKELFRHGWIGKIPSSEIESVAEHSYAVAVLALLLVPIENELRIKDNSNLKMLDKLVIIEKSLVHDLPESQFLDLDKSINGIISKQEFQEFKSRLDKKAEEKIQKDFNQFIKSTFSLSLVNPVPDMNSKQSEEDQFIKLLDSMELYFQTCVYLNKNFISEDLAKPFLTSTLEIINSFAKTFLIISYLFN